VLRVIYYKCGVLVNLFILLFVSFGSALALAASDDSFNDCLSALNTDGGPGVRGKIKSLSDDGRIFATVDGANVTVFNKNGVTAVSDTGKCSSINAEDSAQAIAGIVMGNVNGMGIVGANITKTNMINILTVCNRNSILRKYLSQQMYGYPMLNAIEPSQKPNPK
jgi:hypothetical protein